MSKYDLHSNSHRTNIIPTLTSSQLVYNLSKQQEVKRKICQHNTIWSRDGLFNFLFEIACCFVHTDLEICKANKTYRLANTSSATQSHIAVNGVKGKHGVRWRLLSNMAKHWNNLDGNGCYVSFVEDASIIVWGRRKPQHADIQTNSTIASVMWLLYNNMLIFTYILDNTASYFMYFVFITIRIKQQTIVVSFLDGKSVFWTNQLSELFNDSLTCFIHELISILNKSNLFSELSHLSLPTDITM